MASLAVAALSITLPQAAGAAPADGIHNIQHVVMIMQENRSFDSYFGTYPGANGIPAGVCVPDRLHGGCAAPFYDANEKNAGGPHGAIAAVADVNGGRMNGFVEQAEHHCSTTDPSCFPCRTTEGRSCIDVMGYHDARQIPNYWSYAQNFALQDNMFESAASWSLPEHDYLVSGWSAICPSGDTNPLDCAGSLTGRHPTGTEYAWTDLTHLLYQANVSWRYYIFEGAEPDCESDESVTCAPVKQGPTTLGGWNPLVGFTDVKQDGQQGNIQSIDSLYTDVHQQGTCGLPNVSWVAPNSHVSEHPVQGTITGSIADGQAYVTTLVNSIMRSPCWASTAIFLSWDDWGGFYDHVVPPRIDSQGYGLRVPGLVISPYSKTGYIDHQQLSHDSYLKFIEDDFLAGARLNPATDGRPDKRPSVREEAPGLGDLASSFDFSQAPRPPVLLSPHPAPGGPSPPPGGGPNAPTVAASAVTSRTGAAVTLNGTVNPNGGAVGACRFDFGTSVFYESSAPCAPPPGGGEAAVPVSGAIEGLRPSTTYHFRLLATNQGGTGASGDQVFTTPADGPTITSLSPSTGSTAGGVRVAVGGTGFAPGSSGTRFQFGTTSATSAECTSSSACAVVAPPHAAGVVDVRAIVSGVASAKGAADRFTYG